MYYCTLNILSSIACLCKLRGEGWTGLFNSKGMHCSAVDNGAMNFIPALAICFQIAYQKQGCALNFKGLPDDGIRPIFLKNIHALHSLMMSEPFIRFFCTRSHRVKLRNDIVRDIFLINASYTLFTFSFDQIPTHPPPPPYPN